MAYKSSINNTSLICRLCMQEEQPMKKFTAYLLAKIRRVLPIVVMDGDLLPQVVCTTCEEKLNGFCQFYEQVKRCDEQFRQAPEPLEVADPFLTFHDIHLQMTAAYKAYMNIDQGDLLANFMKQSINNDSIFVCKTCQRTYLSETSAMKHECPSLAKSSIYLTVNNEPILESGVIEDVEEVGDLEVTEVEEIENGDIVTVGSSESPDVVEIPLENDKCRKRKWNDGDVARPEGAENVEIITVDIVKKKKRKRKRRRTNENSVSYRCLRCDKVFTEESVWINHMETHDKRPETLFIVDDT